MEDWTMTLNFSGRDFARLKAIASHILAEVAKAKTYKELPIAGAGGAGNYGNDYSFRVTYTCPLESRIKNLRQEADEMEAKLNKGEKE